MTKSIHVRKRDVLNQDVLNFDKKSFYFYTSGVCLIIKTVGPNYEYYL